MSADPAVWYVRPVFFVSDCEASLRFYGALGFQESWRRGEEGQVEVLQVTRNDFELILFRRSEVGTPTRLFFELFPQQLEPLLRACASAGIAVRDGCWGRHVRIIEDPDGHELFFSVD